MVERLLKENLMKMDIKMDGVLHIMDLMLKLVMDGIQMIKKWGIIGL